MPLPPQPIPVQPMSPEDFVKNLKDELEAAKKALEDMKAKEKDPERKGALQLALDGLTNILEGIQKVLDGLKQILQGVSGIVNALKDLGSKLPIP